MSRLQQALSDLRTSLANARLGAGASDPVCGFCGWPRSAVPVLLTGPGAAICSVCVEHAWRTVLPGIAGSGVATSPADPQLINSIPLSARAGEPPSGRVAEHVRQRAGQVTKLLDQVSSARVQLIEKAGALAWAIERYLESASSDKLVLALPWDELSDVAILMERVAKVLASGRGEADEIARS